MRRIDRRYRSAVLLAAILAAGPASADWLVTRDGAAFEIKGSWEVKGRTVVFKLPTGTLSSMNVNDLDLNRSRELTAEKEAPVPAGPAPAPAAKAVWSLGPQDVAQAGSVPRESDETEAGAARRDTERPDPQAAGGDPRPASFFERLEVTTWEKNEPDWLDGVEVTGKLVNLSDSMAAEIAIEVTIYDDGGQSIETRQAFLDRRSLLKGRSLSFRVPFEGVSDFADAAFDVAATEVVIGVGTIDAYDATLEEDSDASNGR